eukprot:15839825-Heterocapsa_arctica.AAC.1
MSRGIQNSPSTAEASVGNETEYHDIDDSQLFKDYTPEMERLQDMQVAERHALELQGEAKREVMRGKVKEDLAKVGREMTTEYEATRHAMISQLHYEGHQLKEKMRQDRHAVNDYEARNMRENVKAVNDDELRKLRENIKAETEATRLEAYQYYHNLINHRERH